MKIIIAVIFFLLIGAFFIISEENIQLNSNENIQRFFLLYSEWVKKLIDNSNTISGYIVKMEWLPDQA